MAIKHHEMARQASFIAKNAAAWASDFLSLADDVSKPVRGDSVDRFIDEMRDRLSCIERIHREDD